MTTDPKKEQAPYVRFRSEAESLMMNIEAKCTDPDWTPDPITLEMTAAVLEDFYNRGKAAAVPPEASALPSVDLEALLREIRDRARTAVSNRAYEYIEEAADAALAALARRAALTGQPQEAGPPPLCTGTGTVATDFLPMASGTPTEGYCGICGGRFLLTDGAHLGTHGWYAAAPPSAPREGLFKEDD